MTDKLTPSFYPELGDKCHQQQAAMFPVMCVTDLQNKVLISNFPTQDSRWVITKGRVNITTYWDSSTAYFQCALPLLDMTEDVPPLPGNLFRHRMRPNDFGAGLDPQALSSLQSTLNDAEGVENIANAVSSGNKTVDEMTRALEQKGVESKAAKYLAEEIINRSIKIDSSVQLNRINVDDDLRYKMEGTVHEQAKKLLNEIKNSSADGTTAQPTEAKSDAEDSQQRTDVGYGEASYYLDVNEQSNYNVEEQIADKEILKYPLSTADEICIYLGYLPEMRPVTTQDITNNRLLRRGVWVIDTITRSGGASTGIILTVQCRDRLKYLMDTFGSYNTAESDDILVEDFKNFKTDATDAGPDGIKNRVINKRSDVILKIARRGIGQTNKFSIGGRRINAGWIYDPIIQGRDSALTQQLNKAKITEALVTGEAQVDDAYNLDGKVYDKVDDNTYRVSDDGGETWTVYRQEYVDGEIKFTKISKQTGGGQASRGQSVSTDPSNASEFNNIKDKFEEAEKSNDQFTSSPTAANNLSPSPPPSTPSTPIPAATEQPGATANTAPATNSTSALPADISSYHNYQAILKDPNIVKAVYIDSSIYSIDTDKKIYVDTRLERRGAIAVQDGASGSKYIGSGFYASISFSQEDLAEVYKGFEDKLNNGVKIE